MTLRPLPRSFYERSTVTVARELLGKTLIRRRGRSITSGIITETEAYGSHDDPASHAYGGQTLRNRAMFGAVGTAYVYFTYGMHYCVNAVARDSDTDAGAVLIRAVEPLEGVHLMERRRGKMTNLADGPAKLTQAMAITDIQYGEDLTRPGGLYIARGRQVRTIRARRRIGIRRGTDLLWNYT